MKNYCLTYFGTRCTYKTVTFYIFAASLPEFYVLSFAGVPPDFFTNDQQYFLEKS